MPKARIDDLDTVPAREGGNCCFEFGAAVTLRDLERPTAHKEGIKSVCEALFCRGQSVTNLSKWSFVVKIQL
jgi:hypothetical protein